MNARTELADALKRHLPDGWAIHSVPRELDALPTKTVILWTSTCRRMDLATGTYLRWEVETWITVPQRHTTDAFEDSLDAALIEYLAALESDTQLIWDEATRGVLADTLHGYRTVVTLLIKINR